MIAVNTRIIKKIFLKYKYKNHNKKQQQPIIISLDSDSENINLESTSSTRDQEVNTKVRCGSHMILVYHSDPSCIEWEGRGGEGGVQ